MTKLTLILAALVAMSCGAEGGPQMTLDDMFEDVEEDVGDDATTEEVEAEIDEDLWEDDADLQADVQDEVEDEGLGTDEIDSIMPDMDDDTWEVDADEDTQDVADGDTDIAVEVDADIEVDVCVPNCLMEDGNPKQCGSDGCGGGCGECEPMGDCWETECSPEGKCLYSMVPEGTTCQDESLCTIDDQCDGDGNCVPDAMVDCDDENICTEDVCDPVEGCQHFLNQLPCDDGNACTVADKCVKGTCKSGTEAICPDDDNECTDDLCDPVDGCVYEPTPNGVDCDTGSGFGSCDGKGECSECVPQCGGKVCGADNGCGGLCKGPCPLPGDICYDGVCDCIPECDGAVCGSDGCGGTCGECTGNQDKCIGGQCICQPKCTPATECYADGCGGKCGNCNICGQLQEDHVCLKTVTSWPKVIGGTKEQCAEHCGSLGADCAYWSDKQDPSNPASKSCACTKGFTDIEFYDPPGTIVVFWASGCY